MRKRYDYEDHECSFDEYSLDPPRRQTRKSIHSIPAYLGIGFVVLLLGQFGLVYVIDNILPTPLMLADEKTYPNSFITERAHHDLKLLTDMGPRIAGSYENEVLAVDFLRREINFIIQQAHKSQQIELDVQVASGAYYLDYKPFGKVNSYSNLQNIVVKLHSNGSNNSLLVNGHFDSVPTSPGGSDDGINCAVMLEILRKLSRKEDRPTHNIVFLFNGAEETGLQASHGFITQHKWAEDCKVVINLEAAGAGGKIILFQTGPEAPWLMKYYNRVPHPYAQAAGEEIFQSNFVPSDTDFRNFRDFGGLIGVDMAFFKNGYRYHTKYDGFANIPLGSFQHVGDNTLALVENIADAPELGNASQKKGKVVFFDVLGWFMVSYTQFTAIVVNLLAVILSLTVFLFSIYDFKLGFTFSTIKYLAITGFLVVAGWVVSLIFVYCLAFFLDKMRYSMSWYGSPWIVIGLYVVPTIILTSSTLLLANHKNLSVNIRSQVQTHLARLIWTFLLLIGTIFQIRAVYALLIPVLFSSFSFVLIHTFRLQHTIRKWQAVYVIFQLIPASFLMYNALITLCLFIPISGRVGSDKNVDFIIGAMSLFFTVLITSPFTALISLLRDAKYFFLALGAVFLLSFIVIFTPLGFPYSGEENSPTPERYWILHSRRIFHGENGEEVKRDSGYLLVNMDRNSPYFVGKYVKELNSAIDIKEDCENFLLCGLPMAHSKMAQIIQYSTWIPAGQPIFPDQARLELLAKTVVSPTIIRYNMSVSGPDRLFVYLSPKIGFKLTEISLMEHVPSIDNTAIWNGRPLYLITHIWGKEAASLQFHFNVEVPENFSGKSVEIAVCGTYVHVKGQSRLPHYVQFLSQFPDWADLTAFLGSFESWFL